LKLHKVHKTIQRNWQSPMQHMQCLYTPVNYTSSPDSSRPSQMQQHQKANCVQFKSFSDFKKNKNNLNTLQGLLTFFVSKLVGKGPRGPVSWFQNFWKKGGRPITRFQEWLQFSEFLNILKFSIYYLRWKQFPALINFLKCLSMFVG
jgi:hypothetical protein